MRAGRGRSRAGGSVAEAQLRLLQLVAVGFLGSRLVLGMLRDSQAITPALSAPVAMEASL